MSTTSTRESELAAFIDKLVAELAPIELEHNRNYWKLATTGEEQYLAICTKLDSQMRLMFARKEPYEFLRGVAAAGPLTDDLLQRQLELLVNAYRAKQLPPEIIEKQVAIEKKLEATFTNYRAQLDGRAVSDNQIIEVLVGSDDSALRRRAWEASKQVGTMVEGDLFELVKLRNEGARALGFPNFYSMSMQLDELDEAELFALLDELEKGTQPLWDAYKGDLDARLSKRFGLPVAELAPWHYADPFFQQAPASEVNVDPFYEGQNLETLTERYFSAIGFETDDLMKLADLYERPGKNQHAFCMSVDREGEIRVLCNNKSNEKWMGTMLHEYGHAVYDKYVDRSLPWLLRSSAHILATEASAMIFGRLSKNPVWMKRYPGADAAALAAQAGPISRAVREQLLVQTRWELVMIHFERALYHDPAQDLRALWTKLVARFQGVTMPAGRNAPDWAAKIHFSIAPVYYQNYLLGEMLASQLQDHVLEKVLGGGAGKWDGFCGDPRVGEWFKHAYYAPGRRFNWRVLVTRAPGRPLESRPFVDELAGKADVH
ncbi:MAG: M2 family metallopeptidase [Candidatus Eisenbacteria bacterium]|nr:M2 family metallopeptidase [Candidatus Eisenbacteria bacterium]